MPNVIEYIENDCVPGGTIRNYESYGKNLSKLSELEKYIVCDPQTSGGLLVSVSQESLNDFIDFMTSNSLDLEPIGKILEQSVDNKIIKIK